MDRSLESLSASPKVVRSFAVLLALLLGIPLLKLVANLVLGFSAESLSASFFWIVGRSLVFALVQACCTVVVVAAVSTLLAWMIFRSRLVPWISTVVLALQGWLSWVWFLLPGVAVASLVLAGFSWVGLEGFSGLVPVVVAHSLMNVAFVTKVLQERWERASCQELSDSSAMVAMYSTSQERDLFSLYRREWAQGLREQLPLVFSWSLLSFSTVLMLGGGPAHSTPEVLLYHSLMGEMEASRVAVLLLAQLVIGVFAWSLFLSRARKPVNENWNSETIVVQKKSKVLQWQALASVAAWTFLVVFTVLLLSVLWVPLSNWIRFGASVDGDAWRAFFNSIVLSSGTALGCWVIYRTLYRLRSVHRRRLMILSLVSSTLWVAAWLAVGVEEIVSGNFWASLLVSSLALSMIALPVLAQWVDASVESVSSKELAQAQMLGLSKKQLLRAYVFPRLRNMEWRVLGFGFLVGAGDVLVSGILSRDATTLPMLSQQMAGRYDFSGLAPIQIFWMVLASGVALVEWRSQKMSRRIL